MAKTNFTKVEEALVTGLRQMSVSQLIEMADTVSQQEKETDKGPKLVTIQKTLLTLIHYNMQRLHKQDAAVYHKIGISSKQLKKFIEDSTTLSSEEWESIKQTKEKIDSYLKTLPETTDEQIVEQERIKHINKRFNVNEKWLPLQ